MHEEKVTSNAQLVADGTAHSTASSEDRTTSEEKTSRRTMLRGAAIAAAIWGAKALSLPSNANESTCEYFGPTTPCSAGAQDKIHRLLSKATFGYTKEDYDFASGIGYQQWLEAQLDPDALPGHANFEDALQDPVGYPPPVPGQTWPPTVDASWPWNANLINYLEQDPDDPGATICYPGGENQIGPFPQDVRWELVRAACLRAIYSPAQLFERMVEFWNDHLNTFHRASAYIEKNKTFADRRTIRANALGNLKQLLVASAKSPDMLIYLDGRLNTRTPPYGNNENYARELLELHTLGKRPDGSFNFFDQTTIDELAKALTGYDVDLNGATTCGDVQFKYWWYDFRDKHIVFKDENGSVAYAHDPITGESDGDGAGTLDLVMEILTNPAMMGRYTAEFIGRKMCVYFHGDNPSEELVQAVVDAYETSWNENPGGSNISDMLRVILCEDWIECGQPKLKRPFHLMASALRVTRARVSDPGQTDLWANGEDYLVGGFLAAAGHVPFNWPAPDGYPYDSDYWVSTLLPRWDFGARLMTKTIDNDTPGEPLGLRGVDVQPFVTGLCNAEFPDLTDLLDHLNDVMFGGHLDQDEFNDVREYLLTVHGEVNEDSIRECVGLLIACPSFQMY